MVHSARSGTPSPRPYHHGDLKAALLDTAVDLIRERGVQGFTLAEASRRLGVSPAAPYRHFSDREHVLVALAMRAAERLAEATAEEAAGLPSAAERLQAAARAYVRCAARDRPLFEALVGAALEKSTHPELQEAARPAVEGMLGPARELCGAEAAAQELALAVVASAHGHALLLMAADAPDGDVVEAAARRAAHSALALIEGRDRLGGPA
ncbi:MAG TPA: TetR/AcrR family transcriptional regulator [Candidatus Dormibacteraeota bacterium]|jgi:AcrR family transcriptional regulator|nr:TetR/AcrR family transcriptional regulator [Candidatus Dormibacteraeota bacterium]